MCLYLKGLVSNTYSTQYVKEFKVVKFLSSKVGEVITPLQRGSFYFKILFQRERNSIIDWLPPALPLLKIKPETWTCVLDQKGTWDTSVHRPMLCPLSQIGYGQEVLDHRKLSRIFTFVIFNLNFSVINFSS